MYVLKPQKCVLRRPASLRSQGVCRCTRGQGRWLRSRRRWWRMRLQSQGTINLSESPVHCQYVQPGCCDQGPWSSEKDADCRYLLVCHSIVCPLKLHEIDLSENKPPPCLVLIDVAECTLQRNKNWKKVLDCQNCAVITLAPKFGTWNSWSKCLPFKISGGISTHNICHFFKRSQ